MPGFIERFEIPGPVRFKEKGCDLVFQISVKGAIYVDSYDEAAFGATKEEQIENMKKMAADKVLDDLSHWHEGDKLLLIDGRDVLGDSLTVFLREKGINGSGKINELNFSDASKALYREQIMNPHNEKKSEEFNKELEAAVEPHGPLKSVSYNVFSHGMMAGTSSNFHYTLEWKEDGSIIYRYTSSFDGKSFERAYNIKPENAQKMIDFVENRKIAALSKIDIEKPVIYDNFSSATIVVAYDDRSVGGEYHNAYTLQCGPEGMTLKNLEDEIKALFSEIEESGECFKNDMSDNSTPMTGFMGIGMIDFEGQPGHQQPVVGMMGQNLTVPAAPGAGAEAPVTPKKWTCQCGAENAGKFCSECGQPKPTWTCSCGAENKGKFCMDCGQPKPN